MTSLLSNVRWAAVAQASRVGGQLVSLAVLSRLLPPSDYGVMAMAGVVTALAGMLRDMGTGAAIIQRKDLSPELTCTVFWLNVGLGTGLALALALGSNAIGVFFREPQLPGVLLALAVLFPIGSLTAVHQAIIERRSGFKTLAVLDVVTQVLGLLAAIAAALAGAGVYSFVAPAVVSTLISSVWLWRQSGWRPQWLWSHREFKGLWAFTGHLTAFNFVNYFARNADSMIIGRLLGSTALGQYSMAYKVMLFPVHNMGGVVNRVLLPRMSQLQNDPVETRNLYFRVLGLIVCLTGPLMAGLWALREPFVLIAFGANWGVVAPLLAWLAPIGFLQSMLTTTGTVFTASGQTKTLFFLGAINTIVFIVAFIVGAQWGVLEVAIAYFAGNVINSVTVAWLTLRQLDATVKAFWKAIRPALISSLGMAAIITALVYAMKAIEFHAIAMLVTGTFVGLIVYIASLRFLFGQRIRPVIEMMRGRRFE